MDTFSITINQEGVKDLLAWAKAKLSEEDQQTLAEALDKMIEFKGWMGIIVETMDGKVFKTLVEKGVESVFPPEE